MKKREGSQDDRSASEWPKRFPQGTPPADAVEAAGTLFRLVRGIPPGPRDFLSSIEEYPARRFDDLIIAHGVSFHAELADSRRTRRRYKPLRSRRIAVVQITGQLGKMKNTGARSHVTLWFRAAAQPHLAPCKEAEDSP